MGNSTLNEKSNSIPVLVSLVFVLSALVAGLLFVLYNNANQKENVTYNISNSSSTSSLNPDTDFPDLDLGDIDPDLELTEQEEVDYAIESIDDLLAELDESEFADLDSISW